MIEFTEDEVKIFMKLALEEAKKALDKEEIAVACIIVSKATREVVASSSNATNLTYNSTWHCELEAINKLIDMEPNGYKSEQDSEKLREFCSGFALFVTCEPCIMCTTALQIIGIFLLMYYGCKNEKFGGCGSVLSLHLSKVIFRNGDLPRINCLGGLLSEESVNLLQTFYSRGNPRGAFLYLN
ncbi:cytidine and deoxycytidylate deaminase family protein, putative [Theileria annulata]|uniref:Cytidine and deoxycytidylate deaminase family protein, putative n=1 Tax=Theileria annulata TaxID=5874 RepID=Q4UB02_THEAN|nr:cytidine and deoxycytidylate deaminase family protein, putative [Theileria annulata]CAI75999.1 cytidine and deoxycytidylate deaminase family protein, putative [Theileria annulata]|eukprot:XP_955475.1 cytidine and deoxycytidylate deaminase family protein, putative [Theileria annulata]